MNNAGEPLVADKSHDVGFERAAAVAVLLVGAGGIVGIRAALLRRYGAVCPARARGCFAAVGIVQNDKTAAVMIATSAATQAIMIIIRLRLFFLLFSGVAVFIKSSSKN